MSDERAIFTSRCLRVAAAAAAAGATLRKAAGRAPALEVERSGKSVVFPIVTDDRAWRETSVEEALYAVIQDARGWADVKVDDGTVVTLDTATDQAEKQLIRRDVSIELDRVTRLADVLGGDDKLQTLYAAAEL
jgi:hypothetical protein